MDPMSPSYDTLAGMSEAARWASARLRHDTYTTLHTALAKRGMDFDDLAALVRDSKTEIKDVFEGDGDVKVSTLAEYLAAMKYEVRLVVSPLGTARAKAISEGVAWAPPEATDARLS